MICSSLLQLTPRSHGLFEAEKKITDVASWVNSQNDKRSAWKNCTFLSQFGIDHVIQLRQTRTNTDHLFRIWPHSNFMNNNYRVYLKFSDTWNELFVVNWFISNFFLRKYQMKKCIKPTLSENLNEIKQTWPLLKPETWLKVKL